MRNRPETAGAQKRRGKRELVYYEVEETVYIHVLSGKLAQVWINVTAWGWTDFPSDRSDLQVDY